MLLPKDAKCRERRQTDGYEAIVQAEAQQQQMGAVSPQKCSIRLVPAISRTANVTPSIGCISLLWDTASPLVAWVAQPAALTGGLVAALLRQFDSWVEHMFSRSRMVRATRNYATYASFPFLSAYKIEARLGHSIVVLYRLLCAFSPTVTLLCFSSCSSQAFTYILYTPFVCLAFSCFFPPSATCFCNCYVDTCCQPKVPRFEAFLPFFFDRYVICLSPLIENPAPPHYYILCILR